MSNLKTKQNQKIKLGDTENRLAVARVMVGGHAKGVKRFLKIIKDRAFNISANLNSVHRKSFKGTCDRQMVPQDIDLSQDFIISVCVCVYICV